MEYLHFFMLILGQNVQNGIQYVMCSIVWIWLMEWLLWRNTVRGKNIVFINANVLILSKLMSKTLHFYDSHYLNDYI